MQFINFTDTIGIVVSKGTSAVTGDLFITLLLIVALLMAIALMFGIPIEWTAVIVLPLLIGLMSYDSRFYGILAVLVIYLSIIIGKNFFIK